MKHPLVSTVTYLTSDGAPTVILQQTTPDGNKDIPTIPGEGWISFPMKNVHITFSGELQHGVLSSAAPLFDSEVRAAVRKANKADANTDGDEAARNGPVAGREHNRRVTFLVNW